VIVPEDHSRIPIERWRRWLGGVLLVPLLATSGGFVFLLCHALLRGEISIVSRGYHVSSSAYTISANPIAFFFFFVLNALLAAFLLFVTVVVGRRVVTGTRPW
jgi:hypothetical protein